MIMGERVCHFYELWPPHFQRNIYWKDLLIPTKNLDISAPICLQLRFLSIDLKRLSVMVKNPWNEQLAPRKASSKGRQTSSNHQSSVSGRPWSLELQTNWNWPRPQCHSSPRQHNWVAHLSQFMSIAIAHWCFQHHHWCWPPDADWWDFFFLFVAP